MSWVLLAIVATFFWASSNILDKILRTKYLKSSIALTASFGIFGLIFSFILFLVIGIPAIPIQHLIAAFVAGILVPYAVIPYIKALSLEEASRVIPLWHLSPIFTLILAAVFLNEILTPLHYIAFATILSGGILVSIKRMGNVFHLSPAVAFMLLSSLLFAIYDVLLKFAYSTGIFWETFLVVYASITLSSFSLFFLPNVKKNVLRVISRRIFIFLIFLSSLLGLVAGIFWNNAILQGPITLISSFVSFQSLFVLFLATFLSLKFPLFIKEAIDLKTIGMKLIAIGLMAFGLFLLSL